MIPHLLLLFAVVTYTTAAPKNREEEGKLRILSRSQEKLQAIYYVTPEEGIQVVSEESDRNKYVSISTLDGMQLVSARFSISGSGALWKILGYSFFLYNNTVRMGRHIVEPYIVPPATTGLAEKEVKRDHFTTKLFRTLETDNINETKTSALSELLSRPELDIIFEMSEALGQAGINGYDNPAAFRFHGLALHFAKLRAHPMNRPPVEGSAEEPVYVPRRIGKRATCSRPGSWWSDTSYYNCRRCPYQPDCVGMCGAGCSCWSWVCGDCCLHQGCYHHDICCGRDGYFSWSCAFPWNFSCSGYSC